MWASQVGDVYRFRIWDRNGRLVCSSAKGVLSRGADFAGGLSRSHALAAIQSNAVTTELLQGNLPANAPHYALTYIPIKDHDVVIGAFEVYLDQVKDHEVYMGSLRMTETILLFAILLAGGFPCIVLYRETRAHRKSQAENQFLIEHDALTGIPNRIWIEKRACEMLAAASGTSLKVSALLIDLDRFKDINDSLGHHVGDQVLRGFAQRIQSVIRANDAFARFGGDEFIILHTAHSAADSLALAERLKASFATPFTVDNALVECSASIGLAIAPTHADSWDALLACADAALYKGKAEGRKAVQIFEPQKDSMLRQRLIIESDLRRALKSNALAVEYQPCYRLRDRSLVGFEALVRWPERNMSPSEFIPLAEESGLIVELGAWVLFEACSVAAAWQAPLKVAVNISSVQFRHGNIVSTVLQALAHSGLSPSRLELEVTESLLLHNHDQVCTQLDELRKLGVSLALDDFGTGFSSLSYLWKFPFDRVKIDRAFVTHMEANAKASAVVQTVAALGKSLSIEVTAEGVETSSQAKVLEDLGCDDAQGFLFGRSMPWHSAGELARGLPQIDSSSSFVRFPAPINALSGL